MRIAVSLMIIGVLAIPIALIKKPSVTGVESVSIDSAYQGNYFGKAMVLVKNPNGIKISARDLSFTLSYKEKKVANGQMTEDIVLKGKETTGIPVIFTLYTDSLAPYFNELLHADSIELFSLVKGRFTDLRFKMEHSQLIKLPTKSIINGLIQSGASQGIRLSNPRPKKFGLETTEFTTDLHLTNNFSFELAIERAHFSVYSDKALKNEVSVWQLDQPLIIPPHGDTTITAPVKLNNLEMALGALNKLFEQNMDFYVSGTVSIMLNKNVAEIPLTQHLKLDPLKGEIKKIND